MESLYLDHGPSKMSQIMTMDHGYGPWSKSCRLDHDHGPNHAFLVSWSHEFTAVKHFEKLCDDDGKSFLLRRVVWSNHGHQNPPYPHTQAKYFSSKVPESVGSRNLQLNQNSM